MSAAEMPAPDTAFDRVIAAVERVTGHGAKGDGRQRSSRCPAHEDRMPSLSITRGTDRVLIKCHAGCDVDKILEALDLTRADLYDQPLERTEPSRIVATYDYIDEHGELLFQVVRMDPKTFRQRRPDGRGGWTWSLGDTRRVLYRLPQIIDAKQAGQPIYICEGEKDVHAIEHAGGHATCNPGGAGKWRPEYNNALTGADVIIVADRDDTGRSHARAVAAQLADHARTVTLTEPAAGKDAHDHLTAGHTLDQLQSLPLLEAVDEHLPPAPADAGNPADPDAPQLRRIVLTPASAIKPRRVRWLWDGRLAYGTLALLAGKEGLGKSTLAYHVAAQITRGTLEGEDHGHPRAVLICAAEDSWAHTIVPRLIAAGADLDRVYRVEMVTYDDIHLSLSLPRDFAEVSEVAAQTQAGLMILDPIMSVIDAKLDTHRDREVRTALEPLAALADRSRMGILGLIHHNKSGSSDALQLVMGSKAFAAVARSVHTCIPDPDDESQQRKLFATSKNNLGRLDLPVLGFTIESFAVDTEDDGTAWTGRLRWTGPVEGSMQELMNRSSFNDDDRTATTEAADWLQDYLEVNGGAVASADAKKAALKAGHSDTTLKRARKKLNLTVSHSGFPRQSYWALPPDRAAEAVDITEPRKHPDDTPMASPAAPLSQATEPLSGVSPSQATYTPEPDLTPSRATVGPTPGPTDPTGSDLRKHPDTTPPAPARAHAGGDGPTDLTDSLAPLQSHHPRQSGQSGQSDQAPTRATPLDQPPTEPAPPIHADTCPDCHWPYDSNGHATACGY